MYQPDIEAMTRHVEQLFRGAPAGMVELAWTDTIPDDSGRYRLRHAKLFSTDNLSELVTEAARLNATPMCNVYIGAALRHPNTAPFGRAKDDDASILTAAYVDLDDPGAATAAKDIYGALKPTLVVVTGREPHTRAQLWWRLDMPSTDRAQWPELLKAMSSAMGADPSVTNPSRVMRLAGTVAWPVKPGRTIEQTGIVSLREPGQSAYSTAVLSAAFPKRADPEPSAAPPSPPKLAATLNAAKPAADRSTFFRQVNDLALRNAAAWVPTVFGSAAKFQAGTGAWRISSKELGRHLEEDLSIAPTGIVDFGVHDLGDARQGKRTPVDIVIEHGGAPDAKAAAFWLCEQVGVKPEAVGWQEGQALQAAAMPPPARQDGAIKTTDFMTLLTEDVIEEPDYIEPGFAGPGMFVLIAGPPKAQKSFLLQEMLVSAAIGGSFLMDTFTCARPLRVFYLQAEMNRKLLRKRAREFKLLSPDEKKLLATNLIVSERFHMILNEDGVKTAVETIKASFPDAPPDIIAIDPMANVFDQENENDSTQLMRFLTSRIEAIRQQVNPAACIVMVHHARKASSEDMARDPFVAIRGAGALRGYYDSAIVIFRASEESKSRKVHFELRSGESPEPMTVELENGRFITVSGNASSIDKPMARQMLAILKEAWNADEPLSMHPQARKDGRYAVFNLSEQFKIRPKEVDKLLNQWMLNRVVVMRPKVSRGRPAGLEVIGSID
jgi:hypothetical protein